MSLQTLVSFKNLVVISMGRIHVLVGDRILVISPPENSPPKRTLPLPSECWAGDVVEDSCLQHFK